MKGMPFDLASGLDGEGEERVRGELLRVGEEVMLRKVNWFMQF